MYVYVLYLVSVHMNGEVFHCINNGIGVFSTLFYIGVCVKGVMVMVFNATFNTISVISSRSVLLMEENGENNRLAESYGQTSSHNVVSSTPRHELDSNAQC
jgi:hypothetical protein